MPSVDVVIPCYQHGRYLDECVTSVLHQDVEALRILIIDNASTDGSAAIAARLAERDQRIEVVARRENLGPHASFNEGVDWARGDYLMILCADDLLAPGSLASMVSALEAAPDASFALARDVHWSEGEPRPRPAVRPESSWRVRDGKEFILERCLKPEQYLAAGMVLTRTAVHKAAGHYRESLPHTDDFELMLRLALLGRIAESTAVVGIKRMHRQNRTHTFLAERTRDLVERLAALESFFRLEGRVLPEADRLMRVGRSSIAARAFWCGIKDLVRRRASAWPLLGLAVRLDPMVIVAPPFGYLRRMNPELGVVGDLAPFLATRFASPRKTW